MKHTILPVLKFGGSLGPSQKKLLLIIDYTYENSAYFGLLR